MKEQPAPSIVSSAIARLLPPAVATRRADAAPFPADASGDGVADVRDLLFILGAWGREEQRVIKGSGDWRNAVSGRDRRIYLD